MQRLPLLFLLSVILSVENFAQTVNPEYRLQDTPKKGRFYLYWGYNRAAYLKSDIHLKSPTYNFTMRDVAALDAPTKFEAEVYFGPTTLWIPQYNYRFGYYLKNNLGISIGLDHMKYILTNGQTVNVDGYVNPEASTKYAGTYNATPTVLTPDFILFEHTDGLNFLSIDLEYIKPVASFWKNRLRLNVQAGGGIGPVIPRTDAHVFGDGLNNDWHVAGWGVDAKAGVRLEIMKKFFLQSEVRTGYINLPDIILHNEQPQRADQHIFFGEVYVVAGWCF